MCGFLKKGTMVPSFLGEGRRVFLCYFHIPWSGHSYMRVPWGSVRLLLWETKLPEPCGPKRALGELGSNMAPQLSSGALVKLLFLQQPSPPGATSAQGGISSAVTEGSSCPPSSRSLSLVPHSLWDCQNQCFSGYTPNPDPKM